MALVLHEKNSRKNLHVALERYIHETGKVIPVSHSYARHLSAGQKLSRHFGLQEMPERNPSRVPMKETLTRLWQETPDATSFLQRAKQEGYMVSKGYDRRPFLVVDSTGRSFNLVRHLEGINTKAVKERLKGTVLIEEREVVAFVRNQPARAKNNQGMNRHNDRQAFLDTLQQKRNQQKTLKPRMH